MKLLLTIIQDPDSNKLQKVLTDRGLGVTKLSSTGGFLRQGNSTFLIGVEDDQVPEVRELISSTCRERTELMIPGAAMADLEGVYAAQATEVTLGGAIIFTLNVDDFVKV
tara:strand:- start:359 stop:688 length:330 start_codon:yes stop_codon:yes gene_type:complete